MRSVALVLALAACGDHASAIDAPSSPWSMGPSLPKPRLEPGVTAMGTRVIVLGGFDTDVQAGLDITMEVDAFDTGTNTWTQLPDAPVAWTHIQLAALGSQLYLLGGLAGSQYVAHGESYVLDTSQANPTWQTIAPMPAGQERGSAGVIALPGRIYLLGGASTTNALASCIYYDVAGNTWGTLPDLPAPRSHPAAARRSDGVLVLAGGLGGLYADTAAADVFTLQPADASPMWMAKTPSTVQRGGCAYGVIGTQLVCAGGEAGMAALNNTQSYDMYGDAWTDNDNMPMPTAGTQGAAIGDKLYVPGGARLLQFEPTDTFYIYSPLAK